MYIYCVFLICFNKSVPVSNGSPHDRFLRHSHEIIKYKILLESYKISCRGSELFQNRISVVSIYVSS